MVKEKPNKVPLVWVPVLEWDSQDHKDQRDILNHIKDDVNIKKICEYKKLYKSRPTDRRKCFDPLEL